MDSRTARERSRARCPLHRSIARGIGLGSLVWDSHRSAPLCQATDQRRDDQRRDSHISHIFQVGCGASSNRIDRENVNPPGLGQPPIRAAPPGDRWGVVFTTTRWGLGRRGITPSGQWERRNTATAYCALPGELAAVFDDVGVGMPQLWRSRRICTSNVPGCWCCHCRRPSHTPAAGVLCGRRSPVLGWNQVRSWFSRARPWPARPATK